ncbi:hypothetical protein ABW21_db0208813 [Orbilia brochopaga]|nr:hypothetical protein ABW21_db0208813 [Drechslerella brochopaga]
MHIKALGVISCLVVAANARAIFGRNATDPGTGEVLSVLSDPAQVSTPEPFCSSMLGYKPETTTVTTTTTGATSVTYITETVTLSTKTITLGTYTVTDTTVSTTTNSRTSLTVYTYITQAPALVKRVVTPNALKTYPETLVASACAEYISTTSTTTKYAQTKFTPISTHTWTNTVRTFSTTVGGTTATVTVTSTSTSFSTSTAVATIRLAAGQPAPTIYPGSNGYTYQSCLQDYANSVGHALQGPYGSATSTPDQCITTCSGLGLLYAGLEYGGECWCGSAITSGNGPAEESDCTRVCAADSTKFCGNSYRLSLYMRTGTNSTAPTNGLVAYNDFSVLKPYRYKGCYAEPSTQRAMRTLYTDPTGMMTITECAQHALANNATKFGVEYGVECWYDTQLAAGHKKEDNDALCNKPCPGDTQYACGGSLQ